MKGGWLPALEPALPQPCPAAACLPTPGTGSSIFLPASAFYNSLETPAVLHNFAGMKYPLAWQQACAMGVFQGLRCDGTLPAWVLQQAEPPCLTLLLQEFCSTIPAAGGHCSTCSRTQEC